MTWRALICMFKGLVKASLLFYSTKITCALINYVQKPSRLRSKPRVWRSQETVLVKSRELRNVDPPSLMSIVVFRPLVSNFVL